MTEIEKIAFLLPIEWTVSILQMIGGQFYFSITDKVLKFSIIFHFHFNFSFSYSVH